MREAGTRADGPRPGRPRRSGGRDVLVVAAIAAVASFAGISWGLPNADNDWAIDSIAPLGPLAYAERMLYGQHWWSKYPPLHFTLLSLIYAPYVAFLALTGSLESGAAAQYPYGLGRPDISLPLFTLLARTVSASMGVGAAVAACLVGRELAGRSAGVIAGILFAGSPLAVYYAHTANLDMPYMFWSSLALLCLVRIARGAELRSYAWLGVFTAAAIATKDQAYGLFALMPVPLLVLHARRGGIRGLVDRRLVAGLVTAVATYLLAANVLVDAAGWLEHLRFITHEGSQPYRVFPATLAGHAGLAQRTGVLIVDSFTLPATLLGLGGLGLALARRTAGAGLLAFAALSYLALFVGPIGYVLPRFVLPAIFVLAVFAGVAASALWERGRMLPRAAVAAVLAYALVYGGSMTLGFLGDSRYAAEQWLAQNLPVDAVVGTNGEAAYLPRLPAGVTTVPVEITEAGPVSSNGAPEYLVLSEAYYRRYLRRDELRGTMERLLAGELDYEPLATFHQPRLPATELIPGINPRIVILRRRDAIERLSDAVSEVAV